MLKQRVITALCLAPLAVAAILWLPLTAFGILFAAVIGLAAFEWAALAGLSSRAQQFGYVALVLGLCALAWFYALLGVYLIAGALFWVVGILMVLTYPASGRIINKASILGLGMVLLPGVWATLVMIKSFADGGYWLLWCCVLVWAADIGAYFAGRAFGRRKLAPKVSPGKTWEGVAGGALLSAVVAIPLVLWFSTDAPPIWLVAALISVSVFGDLFESALKRETGVKDSGGLLPGHGGVLDRVDSLLAVIPVFGLYLVFFGSGV